MGTVASHLRRLTTALIRQASRIMPLMRSIWAKAMRSEFEHIEDQPGALIWAFGRILGSSRGRLNKLQGRRAMQAARRIAICNLAGLLICPVTGNPASGETLQLPAFTATTCDLPHIGSDIRPRLRCGTVSVPRDYDHPEAGSFRLAVVLIRSEQQPAKADPLVYISGGPGSPLTVYADYQASHPFAPGRDLILVDQRGMGRSDPNICPVHNHELVSAMAAFVVQPSAEAQTRRRAVFAACRDEAIANGIDLKDFGTLVTAQDFETVRNALGVGQWDVFGVSYGTTVAMTLMVRYPGTIRSAVLDSVDPPDPVLPAAAVNAADARAAFFAACDRDTACATAYPHLGKLYRETLKRLEQAPPSIVLPPKLRGSTTPVRLSAPLFEFVIDRLLYYANIYPSLPRLIASIHGGETVLFVHAMAALVDEATNPQTGLNYSANAAVECRDRPRFRQPLPDNAAISEHTSLHDVCAGWVALGPPPVIPIGTIVPTLVLSGQFDPFAGPVVSRHVADLIGAHSRWVEFLLVGHSVRAFSPCASMIVAAFVEDPTRSPDTSCAGHPPPIQFLPLQGAP